MLFEPKPANARKASNMDRLIHHLITRRQHKDYSLYPSLHFLMLQSSDIRGTDTFSPCVYWAGRERRPHLGLGAVARTALMKDHTLLSFIPAESTLSLL